MSYCFTTTLNQNFLEAKESVLKALQSEGFGVLTEIDIQATLKKKLDVDFYAYVILGACHPTMAYKALQTEDKIGTMLPCNVILQQKESSGSIEVSAVDPMASMQAIENPELAQVASEVQRKLQAVISSL